MPVSSAEHSGTGGAHVLVLSSDTGAAVRLSALLRLALSAPELTVTRARGISEAIELAAGDAIQAAVFDLGGWTRPFTAIAELSGALPDVPIVTVAPGDEEQFALQAVAAGADEHLGESAITQPGIRRALRLSVLRRRSEHRLLRAALRDPLTGLPNRTGFLDRVAAALSRARRGEGRLTIVLIAVENLSDVVDAVGHRGADRALAELAERLQELTASSDTLARVGDERFALLIEGAAAAHRPQALVERIRDAGSVPIELEGLALEFTLDVVLRRIDDLSAAPHAVISAS